MRPTMTYIPLRVHLTVILVVLVVALATSLSWISYRAAGRSLEEHTVASLEAIAEARAEALGTLLAHQREQLISATKAVELACDAAGRMDIVCARDRLRGFVRREHALGANLRNARGLVTVWGEPPAADPLGAVMPSAIFRRDARLESVYDTSYADEESGLVLEVRFSSKQIRDAAVLDPTHPADVVANVDGEFQSLVAGGRLPGDAALTRCIQGESSWNWEHGKAGGVYRAYRYVPAGPLCVIAETSRATVLAPITRLTDKLLKTVLGFIVGSVIVAYLLGYVLTQPLKVMKKRVRELKRGDLDSPVPIVGRGEIRDFSEALAAMTTSLRQSRLALLDSQTKLALACKAARLWIWTFDLKSGTVFLHDPADPKAEVRSASLRRTIRRIDERDRRGVLNAIRAARSSDVFEVDYRRKDREASWISAWGQVLRDAAGRPVSMTGVSLDTTTWKEAQRLSNEREKLLAQADMAASLAHEINNPLTSVVGALYMASATRDLPPEVKHYLDVARQNASRITHIGRQMLALYRSPSTPDVVDVQQLLQDVIATARVKAERKKQNFEVSLNYPGNILGFAHELRQAFMNLVVNAIEHSPPGTTITLRAQRSHSLRRTADRGVRIIVANQVENELPEQVRNPAAAFTTTKRERGTGLGLWVTRSVVAKHGGTVRLRSYGAGRNVCCAIYLPTRFAGHAMGAAAGDSPQ